MEYKIIPFFTNYSISQNGIVINNITKKIIKHKIDRYGYPTTGLVANGKKYYPTIHRLVAKTWIENPLKLPQVNHIDGDKTNNDISNLEWVTAKRNIMHSLETGLNKNTNFVMLENIVTSEKREFISVKSLCRFLDMSPNVLLPLIKFSGLNPVLGIYKITLLDLDNAIKTANIRFFGKEITVYDFISNTVDKYGSTPLASYFTGIRSLSNFDFEKEDYYVLGYLFTTNPNIDIDFYKNRVTDTTIDERMRYVLTPYKRIKGNTYTLYDYYNHKEHAFKSLGDTCDFLNLIYPFNNIVTKNLLSQKLGEATKNKKTVLVKGLGFKSSFHNYDWYPYTEEVIISNIYAKPAPMKVYKIDNNGQINYAVGTYELCKLLNISMSKKLSNITVDDVLSYINDSNIIITRLNKPIKNENIVYTT